MIVMAGLVPAIEDVDARHEAGHDKEAVIEGD
jgi:hypothetical protein